MRLQHVIFKALERLVSQNSRWILNHLMFFLSSESCLEQCSQFYDKCEGSSDELNCFDKIFIIFTTKSVINCNDPEYE